MGECRVEAYTSRWEDAEPLASPPHAASTACACRDLERSPKRQTPALALCICTCAVACPHFGRGLLTISHSLWGRPSSPRSPPLSPPCERRQLRPPVCRAHAPHRALALYLVMSAVCHATRRPICIRVIEYGLSPFQVRAGRGPADRRAEYRRTLRLRSCY